MLLLIVTVLLFYLSTIRGAYQNHSLPALFMFKKAIFTKSADFVLQLTKGIVIECKVCQQQDRFKLLSPSIYYGDCYAVEVILPLIYAALRTLE